MINLKPNEYVKIHNQIEYPGTVTIQSDVIARSEISKMEEGPPRTKAKGKFNRDSTEWIEENRLLLIEKNQDKHGVTKASIGRIIYTILKKTEPEEGRCSIIDIKTATDIGLIGDKTATSEGKTIFDAIDRTITKIGNAYLHLIVSRPSPDESEIQNRQKIMKFFIENPELQSQLREALENIKRGEIPLLSAWDFSESPQLINTFYFTNQILRVPCNNSSLALTMGYVTLLCQTGSTTITSSLGAGVAIINALFQIAHAINKITIPAILKQYASSLLFSGKGIGSIGGWLFAYDIPVFNTILYSAAFVGLLENAQDSFELLKANIGTFALMEEVLSSIAEHYQGMKKIHDLIHQHPEIAEILTHFRELDSFIHNKEEIKELETLIHILQSNTGLTNRWFNAGETLLGWKLLYPVDENAKIKGRNAGNARRMKNGLELGVKLCIGMYIGIQLAKILAFKEEVGMAIGVALGLGLATAFKIQNTERRPQEKTKKNKLPPEEDSSTQSKIRNAFEKALPAIGEIDALLSESSLIQNSQKDSKTQYCFPLFVEGSEKKSLLLFDAVWHPMIHPDKAVPNHIHLGEGASADGIILTGANAGGKSSLAKAIIIATVLSYFGLCPSKKASLSRFNYVRMSANIQDSITDSQSLFMSQCRLASSIVQDVLKLTKTKKVHTLTILDELFTQTGSSAGSALAIGTAAELLTERNIPIIISHFINVAKELGNKQTEKHLSYQNLKMVSDGSYALQEGIAEGSNALDIAKVCEIPDSILDTAKNYLKCRRAER